jgi:hypothetical protein
MRLYLTWKAVPELANLEAKQRRQIVMWYFRPYYYLALFVGALSFGLLTLPLHPILPAWGMGLLGGVWVFVCMIMAMQICIHKARPSMKKEIEQRRTHKDLLRLYEEMQQEVRYQKHRNA